DTPKQIHTSCAPRDHLSSENLPPAKQRRVVIPREWAAKVSIQAPVAAPLHRARTSRAGACDSRATALRLIRDRDRWSEPAATPLASATPSHSDPATRTIHPRFAAWPEPNRKQHIPHAISAPESFVRGGTLQRWPI